MKVYFSSNTNLKIKKIKNLKKGKKFSNSPILIFNLKRSLLEYFNIIYSSYCMFFWVCMYIHRLCFSCACRHSKFFLWCSVTKSVSKTIFRYLSKWQSSLELKLDNFYACKASHFMILIPLLSSCKNTFSTSKNIWWHSGMLGIKTIENVNYFN